MSGVSVTDAMAALGGVDRSTVIRMIRTGVLAATRAGGTGPHRIDPDALDALIAVRAQRLPPNVLAAAKRAQGEVVAEQGERSRATARLRVAEDTRNTLLRILLPPPRQYGEVTALADELGMHRVTLSNILSGPRP